MACTCADDIDVKLAERNTRLERAIMFGPHPSTGPHLMLRTEQIEKGRGKPKAAAMFINFCPFCGVKYATD